MSFIISSLSPFLSCWNGLIFLSRCRMLISVLGYFMSCNLLSIWKLCFHFLLHLQSPSFSSQQACRVCLVIAIPFLVFPTESLRYPLPLLSVFFWSYLSSSVAHTISITTLCSSSCLPLLLRSHSLPRLFHFLVYHINDFLIPPKFPRFFNLPSFFYFRKMQQSPQSCFLSKCLSTFFCLASPW